MGHTDHRRARAGLTVAMATSLACSHAPTPPPATPPPTRAVRRFRAPRMPCEAPAFPAMRDPWVLVGWPSAPRFTSVEAEGATLYATTTSAVCRSVDGGRHWEPMLTDLDAPALLAVEGGRLVVRAEEAWEGRDDVNVAWWVSDDSGRAWNRQAHLPEVGAGRIERIAIRTREVNGEFAAVSCGNAMFAIVPSPRGRGPLALRSVDAGLTWSRMSIPPRLREPGITIRCLGHDAIALERGGAVPLVTAFSRDRGTHWDTLRSLPVVARTPGEAPDSDDGPPSSGCAPLSGRGVFCEVQGQGWATDNRGRHWYRANSPVGGRTLPMHGEFLLGIGGGVALSTDAGRRWEIVTVAPGSANLGLRGAILDDNAYWLAGTALWWTDDGGERWTATQLPWELVTVLGRRRWVGLRPASGASDGCGGTVMLTTTGGRVWRPVLGPRIKRVVLRDGEMRAVSCGDTPTVMASRDGTVWRAVGAGPDDDDSDDDEAPLVTDGIRIELRDGTLRGVPEHGEPEVFATGWPRDVIPVAASARAGRVTVIVFGNGTVMRRP